MINVIDLFSEESEMPGRTAVNQDVTISKNERYLTYFTRGKTLQVHDLGVSTLLRENTSRRRSDAMHFDDSHLWMVSLNPSRKDGDLPCQYSPSLLEPGPIPRHKYQIEGSWILRDLEKHIWLPSRYRLLREVVAHRHYDVRESALVVHWDPRNVYYLRFSNNPEEGRPSVLTRKVIEIY